MGFIDWHGNKQDQYEDILEFAKMKEQMNSENFGSQMKRKADAEVFGVPELVSMSTEDMLTLLLKEKRGLDILYGVLLQDAKAIEHLQIGSDMTKQFYNDFWYCTIDRLFQGSKIDESRQQQFAEVVLTKIFKIDSRISVKEHYSRIRTSQEYQRYLSRSFELKSGTVTLFWQWLRYLSDLSAKKNELSQFVKLYQRFVMHLGFYTNQLVQDADIGKRLAARRNVDEDLLKKSLSTKVDYRVLKKEMENPIFGLIVKEAEERRRAEELAVKTAEDTARVAAKESAKRIAEEEARKREALAAIERCQMFKRFVRCSKSIVGHYVWDEEDDSDMITAGRLYTYIKDGRVKLERIATMYPSSGIEMVGKDVLPMVSPEEVKFPVWENEQLHYLDCAISYNYHEKEDAYWKSKGMIYITNQRIVLEFGNSRYDLLYEKIKKITLYDVLPEMLEFAWDEGTVLVQTAKTNDTYAVLKKVLSVIEIPEEKTVNMELLTLDYFKKSNLDIYIFTLEALGEKNVPEEMNSALRDVVYKLKLLKEALKKYPSQQQQAHRFFTYYIPETIRVTYSYIEYQQARVSEQRINQVYELVMQAIERLSHAASQKVDEIYQLATMNTMAQADALHKIIGQDGYLEGKSILKK